MKKLAIYLAASCFILTGCKDEQKKMDAEDAADDAKEVTKDVRPDHVSFELESKSGSSAIGKVSIVEMNGKVKLEASLAGLEPGTHAIHIHEKADCSADDATSSGGHWNPTFEPHGKWGAATGFHKGDIGNFEVDESGNGIVSMETDAWCLGCDDEKKNILGKAIIVHKGADDFTSQPSGAAGARVSCGGIIQ
jgi:Cu-Zn family superoxide dismutase